MTLTMFFLVLDLLAGPDRLIKGLPWGDGEVLLVWLYWCVF